VRYIKDDILQVLDVKDLRVKAGALIKADLQCQALFKPNGTYYAAVIISKNGNYINEIDNHLSQVFWVMKIFVLVIIEVFALVT